MAACIECHVVAEACAHASLSYLPLSVFCRIGPCRTATRRCQYDGQSGSRQLGKERFNIRVEADALVIERDPTFGSCFWMSDLHRVGPFCWSVVGPSYVSLPYMLRPLVPFEANEGCGSQMWLAHFSKCVCQCIGFLARSCRFDVPTVVSVETLPGITYRNDIRMKPLNHIPRAPRDIYGQVGLTHAASTGPNLKLFINFVDGTSAD